MRWPLINLTVSAGLSGSITLAFTKAFDDCYYTDGWTGSYQVYIYLSIGISCAIFQLKSITRSMELYDQMDTIPIYQSALIILNICAGSIVLHESKLYSHAEFVLMVLFCMISISGVWVIIKKPPPTTSKTEVDSRHCEAGSRCECMEFQVNLET